MLTTPKEICIIYCRETISNTVKRCVELIEGKEFIRSQMLLGKEAQDRLKNAKIAVFGIGGVGSYVCEALARCGVGELVLIDGDSVAPSNINRQIIALHSTIGMPKAEVMKKRIQDINPDAKVCAKNIFYTPDNGDEISFLGLDYIIDAIDTVTSKLYIIEKAKSMNIPVISSMGTGNKLDATRFKISDISKTQVCPLARVMRRELKNRGITSLKVLWSDEKPLVPLFSPDEVSGKRQTPGSVSFVPSVAGLIIAGEVIKDLM